MSALVFIDPAKLDATPFTTSDVIAEFAGVKHHAIQQLVSKHEADFKEFGVIAFEMRKPRVGSKGGRPETIYRLNEEQATLLMTYLKNTERVRAFKKELVRQFYAMRKELVSRQINRAKMLPARREMTDAIRDCLPESSHKSMWYRHYTDLAYRAACGCSAVQMRKQRNAPKTAVAADYMTAAEMDAVRRVSGQISVLIEMGMEYQQIKRLLLERQKEVV